MTLSLSLACSAYDRTQALYDGKVTIPGVDLIYLPMPIEEIFYRMVRFEEFDIAELSLSSYTLSLASDRRFVAIPVFPSRMFRHSGIYVGASSKVKVPSDLIGKRVGIAEYQLTANVWIRGMLQEYYGVPYDSVQYRTGGLHAPGREEKIPIELPPGISVEPIGPNDTLCEMLLNGELDAIYTPRTPLPFLQGNPDISRLFSNCREEEETYFAKSGILPIMHVIVMRRSLYERHRWLARALFDSFETARQIAMAGIDETASLRYMLPWLHEEVARTREVLGWDYWSYGLDANIGVLETFLRYSREQGLASPDLTPADLFAPETLGTYVI